MDSPKEDSLWEQRATIEPDASASNDPDSIGPNTERQDRQVGNSIDAPKEDSLQEERATIDPDVGPTDDAGISARKLARAKKRNPRWAKKLGCSPADFGCSAGPDTDEFAKAVASFQRQNGLGIDGVAGPKTHRVAHAQGALEPGVLGAADVMEPGVLDVQGKGMVASTADVHAAAAQGLDGPATTLPFADQIQASFGNHDLGGVQAHVGGAAEDANKALGAEAYASANKVAFAGQPSLHTAAHEAAHVVQQRGGVQLKDGVGVAGDSHEQHADAVADAVVRGESAESLLATVATTPSPRVQLRRSENTPATRIGEAEQVLLHLTSADSQLDALNSLVDTVRQQAATTNSVQPGISGVIWSFENGVAQQLMAAVTILRTHVRSEREKGVGVVRSKAALRAHPGMEQVLDSLVHKVGMYRSVMDQMISERPTVYRLMFESPRDMFRGRDGGPLVPTMNTLHANLGMKPVSYPAFKAVAQAGANESVATILKEPELSDYLGSLKNPAVDSASRALSALRIQADALPKNPENEETGPERDALVEGIEAMRLQIANLDNAGLPPADLQRTKSALYAAVQSLAPSYYQGNEANILKSDERKALRYRTCAYSSLGMALESMGKTAGAYTGDWDKLLAVDAYWKYEKRLDLANDKVAKDAGDRSRLLGLRLPDFLQLAMVAHYARGTSDSAIETAAGTAWSVTGGAPYYIVTLAERFSVSATIKYFTFDGSIVGPKTRAEEEAQNWKDPDEYRRLTGFGGDHAENIKDLVGYRNEAEASGSESKRRKYDKSRADNSTALEGRQVERFPLDDYKSVIIEEIGAEIGAGGAVMVNLYNHWVRLQELHDEYFIVDDPGGKDRANRKVLWDEARAMSYFRKRIVLK